MTGTIWLCSFIFIYLILWPAFVKNNSIEALEIKNILKKPISNILGIAGIISIVLGLVRGIIFSGIQSFQALLTPYGRSFASAILITILMIVIGKVYGHNIVNIPCENEISQKIILKKIYFAGSFILICYAMLLFCMVAMRFGGF
jgi:uncharacterized membrane protein